MGLVMQRGRDSPVCSALCCCQALGWGNGCQNCCGSNQINELKWLTLSLMLFWCFEDTGTNAFATENERNVWRIFFDLIPISTSAWHIEPRKQKCWTLLFYDTGKSLVFLCRKCLNYDSLKLVSHKDSTNSRDHFAIDEWNQPD